MLLSDGQAWAFAMAWQNELQGRVKLITDPNAMLENGFDIVKSYEWIQIDFAGSWMDGIGPVENPMRLAACARVASIVWYTLSRCPGYGRIENPVFWKRVMSELNLVKRPVNAPRIADAPSTNYFQSVSDSVRFFDHPDHSFPSLRLQLKVNGCGRQQHSRVSDRSIVQVLCGQVAHSNGKEEREAKLHTILERLRGYLPLNTTVGDGIIPVSVNANDSSLETASLQTSQPTSKLPLFALHLNSSLDSHMSRRRWDCPRQEFDDLFAQLPTTRSIRSVTFDTYRHPMARNVTRDFDVKDYKALGSALFHPDSAMSTWTTLSVDLAEVTEEKMAALKGASLKNADGRPPLSAPCIHHLRVSPTTTGYVSADSVLRLLSVLGQSLLTLDVAKCSVFNADQVRQLLRYCPNLRSLSINHDGSAWSEEAVESPRLERLHLYLDPNHQTVASFSDTALQTALSKLEVLRVSTYYTHIEKSRDVILRLLEKLQSLSYFHWQNLSAGYYLRRDKPNGVIPYDESRKRTMDKLSDNGKIPLSQNVTHRLPTTTVSKRVALLSALDAEQSTASTATDVGRHVAARVMALATPRVPRELCIEE